MNSLLDTVGGKVKYPPDWPHSPPVDRHPVTIINNTGTITTDYNLGENTSAMASFLHQKYKFDFCAQIEDLNTDQTTITCISGLTWPLCAVFALALGSTVCGFALARIGRNPTGRRTGMLAGEQVLEQVHL